MIWQCVYVLSISILVIHLYFRYSRAGRMMANIPGPKEYFFIGHMLTLHESPDVLFRKLRQFRNDYGRIYKLQGFHFRTIHLNHPDDVEALLSSTRYIDKDMPYTFLHNWLGNGLLVSNGEKWQQRRKLLTPSFHFNIRQKFFSKFCEQTETLLKSLETEVDKSKTDITPFIHKLTVATMCETSFGLKISDSISLNKYIENVHKLGQCITKRLTQSWCLVDFLYMLSPCYLQEKSLVRDVHYFTEEIIRKRRAIVNKTVNSENCNKIMLDVLLHEEKSGNINEKAVRDEIDTFLFESYDTTSSALIFMIVRIANEPVIQNLIYEELDSIFGDTDRDPTIGDLSKMKYLECCIKESLRLYPSVPFISRYVTEDFIIAGYEIPKNTYYDIHIYDVHRNPDLYPDPDKFIPERFLPENSVKRHPYAYIPFSAGSRNCIGQKFALMEMKTVMAGILRKYRLEPVTRIEDLNFIADMILRVSHPLYVRFCQRKPLF